MRECLSAYTPPSPPVGYVGYINISREGDQVIITARPETLDGSGTVSLTIPVEQAEKLFSEAAAALSKEPRT